jgi:hypothetical protein
MLPPHIQPLLTRPRSPPEQSLLEHYQQELLLTGCNGLVVLVSGSSYLAYSRLSRRRVRSFRAVNFCLALIYGSVLVSASIVALRKYREWYHFDGELDSQLKLKNPEGY